MKVLLNSFHLNGHSFIHRRKGRITLCIAVTKSRYAYGLLSSAIIIFGVSGFIMVVVSLFTKKIPRDELGGLTWPTINERPISHGAIGEGDDPDDPGKAENGTMELLEKNGKVTF